MFSQLIGIWADSRKGYDIWHIGHTDGNDEESCDGGEIFSQDAVPPPDDSLTKTGPAGENSSKRGEFRVEPSNILEVGRRIAVRQDLHHLGWGLLLSWCVETRIFPVCRYAVL